MTPSFFFYENRRVNVPYFFSLRLECEKARSVTCSFACSNASRLTSLLLLAHEGLLPFASYDDYSEPNGLEPHFRRLRRPTILTLPELAFVRERACSHPPFSATQSAPESSSAQFVGLSIRPLVCTRFHKFASHESNE